MSGQLHQEQVKLANIVSSKSRNLKIREIFNFWLQESEIAKIQSLITNIKDGNLSEESEDLAKLLVENSKLKFRLEVLNKVRQEILIILEVVQLLMKHFSRLRMRKSNARRHYRQA